MEVGGPDKEFAVGCAVVLDVGVDVLYGPGDDAPAPLAALPVHRVGLPRSRLPVSDDARVVALRAFVEFFICNSVTAMHWAKEHWENRTVNKDVFDPPARLPKNL